MRPLISKDDLTSLQRDDQNISENISYFNYNYDDVFSSPYDYTIVIMPVTKENAG